MSLFAGEHTIEMDHQKRLTVLLLKNPDVAIELGPIIPRTHLDEAEIGVDIGQAVDDWRSGMKLARGAEGRMKLRTQ